MTRQLLQRGLVERIPRGLAYAPVLGLNIQPGSQLPTLGAVGQRAARFFVLDHHHWHTGLARTGAQAIDGVDDARDLETLILARAERLLDVDD
jgi:hypothetical protein